MQGFTPPGEFPVCGADVPKGARACPECGACPETGWSDDTRYDGLDLPEEDADTTSPKRGPREGRFRALVPLIALVTLLALGLLFLAGRF